MLHLGGRIALGVDVADLLQLQRAFHGHGVVHAPAHIKGVAGVGEGAGNVADVIVLGEDALYLLGDVRQLLDVLLIHLAVERALLIA